MPTRAFRVAVVGCAMVAAVLWPDASPAVEKYQANFLRRLQGAYPDVALEYLDMIEGRPDLPERLRETLDLERCTSHRAAAQTLYGATRAEFHRHQAQKYLDKFLKEHPNHPQAAAAMISWGDFALDRAERLFVTARRTADANQKAKLLGEARTALEQARSRFGEAGKHCAARLEQLKAKDQPAGTNPSPAATELELSAVEARFKVALVGYHLAQTYDDSQAAARQRALKEAAKLFDAIYQQYRNNVSEVCLFAHLWQGKALEELGDLKTAQWIYEEVLAGEPETAASDSPSAPLFCQARLFQFRALAQQGKSEQLLSEGSQWLRDHRLWRRLPAYQAVAIEVAKAQVATAEKATGSARKRLIHRALSDLASAIKTDSQYKHEALLLRSEVLKMMGSENFGVDEYLALGDSSLAASELAEAEQYYTQAYNRASAAKSEKQMQEARTRINLVGYRRALALYTAGKHEEAYKAAGVVAKEDAADPSAASAAAVALSASLAMYESGQAKKAGLERLERVAGFIINKWPGRPEADDARMSLAKAHLLTGDSEAAMGLLGQVNVQSKRFAVAQYVLGQLFWKAYGDEKRKDPTARNAKRMEELRLGAQKSLQGAVEAMQQEPEWSAPEDTAKPGEQDAKPEQPRASPRSDAELLLVDVLLEGKQYKLALPLLESRIEKIKAAKPESLDPATVHTFIRAVRAHFGAGETDKGAAVALLLVELSGDNAQVNAALANFAKLLGLELKRAEAAVTDAQDGNPAALPELLAKRDALRQLLAKLLEPLGNRKEHALADMVYLGDTCAALGLADQARQQYQRILERAQQDEQFAKQAEKAMVRVRAQLAGLLRTQGQFEEAAKQVDALIAKHPNALEPKMTRAYILEDWAKKDPTKYDAAVAQWTEIRLVLGRMKHPPPEYYAVIYKVATILFDQYQKTKDKSKLDQAEKVLRSTLVMNARLTGPDLVAQYHELLRRIAAAREGKKRKE